MLVSRPFSSSDDDLFELMTRKQLELNSLLEITQAVNENHKENALLSIIQQMISLQLGIDTIYIVEHIKDKNQWKTILAKNIEEIVVLEEQMNLVIENYVSGTYIVDGEKLSYIPGLEELDIRFPVYYKNQTQCYVFLKNVGYDSVRVEMDVNLIRSALGIMLVATENKRLQEERIKEERLRADIDIAAQVQSMLFPKKLLKNSFVDSAFEYHPQLSIGGDYFDVISINDDEFIFCIADVSGKGISSALLMANFQATLRLLILQDDKNLEQILRSANKIIYRRTLGDRHITLFLGHYNNNTRELKYINAAHSPSFIVNSNNIEELKTGSIMIGAFKDLPFVNIGTTVIPEGSILFNYTDGLVELNVDDNLEFEEEDIKKFLLENINCSASEINTKLMEKVNLLLDGQIQSDDITVLNFKFK